jgi:hypothetical protein
MEKTMAEHYVVERFAVRILVRGLGVLVLLAMLAYPVDWAIWRTRVAAGGGMGKITVDRFVVAELKGSKEDYYPEGTTVVDCSKSLFPEAGSGACWWIARHREVIERY